MWASDGDARSNDCPMLNLSDRPKAQQRVAESINGGWKPSHPDAEGIADDSGDEYGEHQCPDAKIAIEIHRMSTAATSTLPQHRKSKVESDSLAPTSCP
jgi:hypothetical protein